MATLTIVRGLPGSGKSTFAKTLGVLHVERDMFCMKNGEYIWSKEELQKNNELCKEVLSIALKNGNDCVVCNPFVTIAQVNEYIDLAAKFNAKSVVYRCTGRYNGLHDVPKEHMKALEYQFEDFNGELIISQMPIIG